MSTAASLDRVAGKPARRLTPAWLQPLLGVLGVLALLEALSRLNVIEPAVLPPVSAISGTLFTQLLEPSYWQAVGDTLRGWAIGLGIGAMLAVPLGLLIGLNHLLFRATRPIVESLRPIPSVGLVPLAILLFGIGLSSKVFLAAIASFWQMLILCIYGARDLEPMLQETARSYQIGWLRRLTRVTLPGTFPYIATGLRIASTVALLMTITAEILIGMSGLGLEMNRAREGGNVDLMYAMIVTAGLVGIVLNYMWVRLESQVLKWHPSQRNASS